MPFDIIGARNDGYTDDEIISHLSTGFDVSGAMTDGYSLDEIAAFVGQTPEAVQTELPLAEPYQAPDFAQQIAATPVPEAPVIPETAPIAESPYAPEIEPAASSTVAVEQPTPMEAIPRIVDTPETAQQVAEELFTSEGRMYPEEEPKPGIQPIRTTVEGVKRQFHTLGELIKGVGVGDQAAADRRIAEAKKNVAEFRLKGMEGQAQIWEEVVLKHEKDKETFKKIEESGKEISDFYKPSDKWKKAEGVKGFAQDVIMGLTQMPTTMAATVAGGPAAGAGWMATQIAGGKYEQLVEEGVDPERALVAGITDALMQSPLEQIGVGKVMKVWKPGKGVSKAIKEIIEAGATEFITEGLQTYPEAITDIWAKSEGKNNAARVDELIADFWEITKDAAYQASVGGVVGLAAGGPGAVTTGRPTPPKPEAPEVVEGRIEEVKEKMLEEGGIITEKMQKEKRVPKPPDTKVIPTVKKEEEVKVEKEEPEEGIEVSKPVKPEVDEALPPLGKELEEAESAVTEKPEPTVEKVITPEEQAEIETGVRKKPEAKEEKKVEKIPPEKVAEKVDDGLVEDVKTVLDDYEDNKSTVTDVVDSVEDLDIPELADAVNTFREEQETDRELKGRGDMDTAEDNFMAAVEEYTKPKKIVAEKKLPTPEKKPEAPKPKLPLEEPVTFKESISEVEKQIPKKLWDSIELRIDKTPGETEGSIVKEGERLVATIDPATFEKWNVRDKDGKKLETFKTKKEAEKYAENKEGAHVSNRGVEVIFHEFMGHAGASNVTRTNQKVHKRLSALYKTTAAKEMKEQIKIAYAKEFKGMDKAEKEEALFSEWLAHNIETYQANPKDKKSTAYKIVQAVRQFLAELGLKKDTIDTAMESVVKEIRKTTKFEAKVETSPDVKGGKKYQIDAFHGSPHKFDKFQMSQLGTGEGAQAFGHGLYFTSEKDVARFYSDFSGDKMPSLFIDGKDISKSTSMRIQKALRSYKRGTATKEDITKAIEKSWSGDPMKRATRIDVKNLNPNDIKFDEGNLYTVTLHKGKKPGEYDYLISDGKLSSSQLAKIKKQAKAENVDVKNLPEYLNTAGFGESKGQATYQYLSDMLGSDKEASDFLLKAGIDGIDYPAGSLSGVKGSKARNYVVFDERAVTIEPEAKVETAPPKATDRTSNEREASPDSNVEKDGIRYSVDIFNEEKAVDVPSITNAIYNGKKIPAKSMVEFQKKAKKEGVSQKSIDKAIKKYVNYNKIRKVGNFVVLPAVRPTVVIRNGVLSTPAVQGKRRERTDKLFNDIRAGRKVSETGALFEGGAQRTAIPKEARGLEPQPFLNMPITDRHLSKKRPSAVKEPLVATGNPHVSNFKKPNNSWDESIKAVRVKPVHKGSKKVNKAVIDAINYAKKIKAKVLITTFRAKQPFVLAKFTNMVPTDTSHPDFDKYWKPNPNPRPTDPKKFPDYAPYIPRGTLVKEAFRKNGWEIQKNIYRKTKLSEDGTYMESHMGSATKQEKTATRLTKEGKKSKPYHPWVVTRDKQTLKKNDDGYFLNEREAGKLLGDKGGTWWWPRTRVFDKEVLDGVGDFEAEYCDLLHEGCPTCRNCQKVTYPESAGSPIIGVTDEPFCEHGCPQCFVRLGQSGVKGRKGISFGQNAKQAGYGEADLGDIYKNTVNILQGVVRKGQKRVDYVSDFLQGSPADQIDKATSLYLDKQITVDELKTIGGEIRKGTEDAQLLLNDDNTPNDKRIQLLERFPEKGIRFAKELPAFYSPTARKISELKQEKGVVPQIQSMIKKGQLKKAEVEWMGLEEWLAENPKATKTEVQDFVKANEVTVEEVVKGREPGYSKLLNKGWEIVDQTEHGTAWVDDKGIRVHDKEKSGLAVADIGEGERFAKSPEVKLMREAEEGSEDETKFAQGTYVLPGGTNQRELMFVMPQKIPIFSEFAEQRGFTAEQAKDFLSKKMTTFSNVEEKEINKIYDEWSIKRNQQSSETYKVPSAHQYGLGEKADINRFAHARVNDRTTPEGEKVLFIEEIQSDWAREAREKGVKKKGLPDGFRIVEQKNKTWVVFDDTGNVVVAPQRGTKQEVIDRYWKGTRATPDFPFRKNWQEFALKNLLKRAVSEGYDKISWISGEQTADRYDLSKIASRVEYETFEEGGKKLYEVVVYGLDGEQIQSYDNQSIDDIEKTLGKGIAQKIGDDAGSKGKSKNKSEYRDWKALTGDDLISRPEWAFNLYDRQIPNILKKYAKKWDAKVEETNISGAEDAETLQAPLRALLGDEAEGEDPNLFYVQDTITGEAKSDGYETAEDAIKGYLKLGEGSTQLSLPITPSMKESIPAGQPMFAKQLEERDIDKVPIKSFKGVEKDAAVAYEAVKDAWIGEKDVRVLRAQVEKRKLQKRIKAALGLKRYGEEAKLYDQAMQIYIDTQRSPDDIKKFKGKLTPYQQKVVDLSQKLSPELQKIADEISDSYQEMGLEAVQSEVIKNVLDNYAGRIWDLEEKKGRPTAEAMRKFGTKTGHAKQRVFTTILEGWAAGYDLKVKGATNNLQILKDSMVKTIEDKRFLSALQKIKTIDGDPLVTTEQKDDYVRLEHPNLTVWKWAGKAEEGKAYGRNFFMDEEGNLFEKRSLYAPKEQAKNLNNILGVSKLKDLPGVKLATKYNAIFKAWILQSSFFHHLAYMRSYELGTLGKKFGELDPISAYRQGIQAIENEDAIITQLVRNGLTLGVKQDWNEELLHEKTLIGKILDKTKATKATKDKILELRERQAEFLFGELGAGLKAKAAMIEYRNLIKKHPNMDTDRAAKLAANLINDDFGGLHLQRLGRNPTVQHIFRLFALAPDWTESNIRSMVKMVGAGTKEERAMYQKFWAGIAVKAVILTVAANALLSVGGDEEDEFGKKMKRSWKEGKFRWLDVDITRLYKALGGKSADRKYFSIAGHFKDPLKFATHPIRSAHHKGSVLYKSMHEALVGKDWAGRRYTTLGELIGQESELGKEAAEELAGKTVTWKRGKKGALGYEQLPSYLLAQLKGTQPVQVQNLISYIAGEMEGFDALANSMGLGVATTYGGEEGVFYKNKNRIKEVKEKMEYYKDRKQASKVRDLYTKNRRLLAMDDARKDVEKKIRKLKKEKAIFEERGTEERVKRYDDKIEKLLKQFNKRFNQRVK